MRGVVLTGEHIMYRQDRNTVPVLSRTPYVASARMRGFGLKTVVGGLLFLLGIGFVGWQSRNIYLAYEAEENAKPDSEKITQDDIVKMVVPEDNPELVSRRELLGGDLSDAADVGRYGDPLARRRTEPEKPATVKPRETAGPQTAATTDPSHDTPANPPQPGTETTVSANAAPANPLLALIAGNQSPTQAQPEATDAPAEQPTDAEPEKPDHLQKLDILKGGQIPRHMLPEHEQRRLAQRDAEIEARKREMEERRAMRMTAREPNHHPDSKINTNRIGGIKVFDPTPRTPYDHMMGRPQIVSGYYLRMPEIFGLPEPSGRDAQRWHGEGRKRLLGLELIVRDKMGFEKNSGQPIMFRDGEVNYRAGYRPMRVPVPPDAVAISDMSFHRIEVPAGRDVIQETHFVGFDGDKQITIICRYHRDDRMQQSVLEAAAQTLTSVERNPRPEGM